MVVTVVRNHGPDKANYRPGVDRVYVESLLLL
jgi:hypothetical protein